jgi:hypothetical protein
VVVPWTLGLDMEARVGRHQFQLGASPVLGGRKRASVLIRVRARTSILREPGTFEHHDADIQAARNQALFRQVNERIEELNRVFSQVDPIGLWVCECADQACIAQIQISIDGYETIRRHAGRFLVLRGHEVPGIERVVESHDGYVVIEKVGPGKDVAVETDPRAQIRQSA